MGESTGARMIVAGRLAMAKDNYGVNVLTEVISVSLFVCWVLKTSEKEDVVAFLPIAHKHRHHTHIHLP